MPSRTELIVIVVVGVVVAAFAALGLWYLFTKSSGGNNDTGLFAYMGKDGTTSQNCVGLFALDYVTKKVTSGGDLRGAYAAALQQIGKISQCSVACVDKSVPWVDLSEKSCVDAVGPASGLIDGTVNCEKLGAAFKAAVKSGACKAL